MKNYWLIKPKFVKVSIIIPFYKNIRYLDKCLESLSKQTYKNLEIILVSDGGKKWSMLPGQWSMVKNLKIFEQEHQGPAVARNLGAGKAKGSILIFVDADMIFDRNFVTELINPIEKGEVKGTFSKQEYVANWENNWARCWNFNLGLKNKRKISENYTNKAPVFRAILRKEFDRVGGFESTGYADDWTLSKKLDYKAQAAERAVYYHYNPQNLCEVFYQAKWRVKRSYKFGIIGELLVLIKSLLPFSILIGLYKSIKFKEVKFILFKIVFDFGSIVGLLEKIIAKNYY